MRYPRFSKKKNLKNAFYYYCCYNSVKINFVIIVYLFSDWDLKPLQNGLSDFWKNVYMLRKVDFNNYVIKIDFQN